jgi:tripartite-type tricarboxylate transporter receptor subunit TctC
MTAQNIKRNWLLGFVITLVILTTFIAVPGYSGEYPSKPVTLMVGFSPGGGVDTYARALSSFIHEPLGQPMVVVNKTGAAGMIAAKFTMDGPVDGSVLYITNVGSFTAKALMDGKKAKVNPIADMLPLGTIGQLVTGLIVPIDSPFKSAADLVKFAKENPGKLKWSHPGRGSLHMLSGAAFLIANDIKAKDIPFKGGSKARNAVSGQQVDFGFMGIQLLSGFETKLRALGVSTKERDKANPDIPSFGEQGLPVMDIAGPIMVLAHKDLPENIKAVLVPAIKQVAESKGYASLIKKTGTSAFYRDPDSGRQQMQSLNDALSPIVDKVMGR